MAHAPASSPPRLLDRVRNRLRVRHDAIRTEEAYLGWIKRYILFHGKRHPEDMGAEEIEAFLRHLAADRDVAAATQNQAKSAILFLYREALQLELPWLENVIQAKVRRPVPVVLTEQEVQWMLSQMCGVNRLIATLLCGAGLRLMEAVRWQVKDVAFSRREIVVRSGKGDKDRVTMLPAALVVEPQTHLSQVMAIHPSDLARGGGTVYLPHALARKYQNAEREWRAVRVSGDGAVAPSAGRHATSSSS